MASLMNALSFAAVVGLDAILVKPVRAIGPFTAQVTIREQHTDELEITEQPVDMGASITDHSYIKPAEVVIECGWSNSPRTGNSSLGGLVGSAVAAVNTLASVAAIVAGNAPNQARDMYEKLLVLQRTRTAMDVYTGKRYYKDMLIKQLFVTTDKETENILMVRATLRQIIIVSAQTLTIASPLENQRFPGSTAPPSDRGFLSLLTGSNANLPALRGAVPKLF